MSHIRKRIIHKIILKCRVCLDEYDEDVMYDLFKEGAPPMFTSEKSNVLDNEKLSEKLEYCCGVRIRESPDMPAKVCNKCFCMARIWFNFRKVCITSQIYLESMCKDREKPAVLNEDGEYLEYLMEDLQTFRAKARNSHNILTINVEDEVAAADSDDDDNHEDVEEDRSLCESFDKNVVEAVSFEDVHLEEVELNTIERCIKNENNENTDRMSDEESDEEQLDEQPEEEHIETEDEAMSDDMKSDFIEIDVEYVKPTQRKKIQKKSTSTKIKEKYRKTAPSTYMCNICGNVYNKKTSFTYHMNRHSDIKTHACEICGKGFRQVCDLKRHIRRHTGEKRYKCSYCDRRFIEGGEKLRHERVHTNTRPFVCSVCDKSFVYSTSLNNHFKLHSGEKNYNCLVCEKAFTLPHHYKAHLATTIHKQKEALLTSAG